LQGAARMIGLSLLTLRTLALAFTVSAFLALCYS
jgi:hypothetical protein